MATATSTTTTTATSTTTSLSSLKAHTHQPPPKPRRCNPTRKFDPPTIISSENSWCCPASKPIPSQTHSRRGGLPIDPNPAQSYPSSNNTTTFSSSASSPSSSFRIRFSPGSLSPVMDFTPSPTNGGQNDSFNSSFTRFNSMLTAGLLNPMSPPPPPPRSSPTLFEMMASEPEMAHPKPAQIHHNGVAAPPPPPRTHVAGLVPDKKALMMQRVSDLLSCRSPGNQFNDPTNSDIKLTLSAKDGFSVQMSLHRPILVAHSRFFAVKLSDRWVKQQRTTPSSSPPYNVEIAECDDVEVYIEALRLMYCKDLRKRLMKEDVPKVLGILKVSAAVGFDAGVLSCLEYLEAAPWAEDEEEKVASLLSELRLEGVGAGEVLKRVSLEVANGNEEGNDNEEVLVKLLHVVLEGKDEKARREMKGLVTKMLRENSSHNELRKESLYSACDGCLQLLCHHFSRAAESDLKDVGQIARQADNLHWILDILIDRQMAEDFLKTWASQTELSESHSKVAAVHRYEVSRVTARLFVGIGKGQLLASKDVRFLLLRTWLVPFYDDFGWMRRASRGLDRHLIEDGLSNTILTLPLAWQQEILLAWFNRFLNSGEDCPNIQRGFEVWWRRSFWGRNGEQERPPPLRITAATVEK
ncbi:BTB/POZ domain-containing protein At1g63850 [Argentina anserina]|uniref:BTB/POZ domain-containing protein At1g63850 n=1 Tax=Argentina anserina TaxID=57926 RepID=UPI0021762C9E|nr:BTB/POZ domain-containing protein At1g63850 [Potentilla anserina]XP_050376495.1 BTB/POZ domain-containing protein At1g63850 [Potentilla anserina]